MTKKIEASWEDVTKEYSRHGYIQAQLNTTAVFDDAGRKVQFQVILKEGPQFRMGTFTPQGFAPAIAEKLRSRWKLKAGDIFDASYLPDFIKKELTPVLSNSSVKSPRITASSSPDPAQLAVNVLLRLE